MSIRRLMVPLAGGARDETVLATASVTAELLGAHADAVFAQGESSEFIPVMGEGYSGLIAQDIVEAVEKAATERAETAAKHTKQAASDANIAFVDFEATTTPPSMSFHRSKGPLLSILHAESQLSDLVVYAHQTSPLSGELKNAMPDLLVHCHRPFLISTVEPPKSIGTRIVIGWDGGNEAASAIRQARGFFPSAESVLLVGVGDDAELVEDSFKGPLAYLAYHGVSAQTKHIAEGNKHAGELLLSSAREANSDLLVVGGYGHSRVREFIFGGATRHILSEADLPVFMAH